ncbi:hypothetical protein [Hoeflea sp.]|uniref:hypothetical protein n=1 Tax=Hoeflea sp. TaxID=1940281 RepID=UPI0019B7575A|nr:hypothetical protein [Hoeflea sp.]MBC7280043.1 hypothetical protein [Hoeflea sp.]
MPFLAPLIAGIGAAITAVGSFIAPLTTALGGLGAFGKVLLTIGLNLAMTVAQGLFAKKEKPPPSGVQLDLQFGEGGSRDVKCGFYAVAGLFIYPNAYGPANSTLQQAFQISDFPVTSLDKVWIDGELATLGAVDTVKGAVVTSGGYAGRIWVKLVDGWQTEADAGLVAGANPTGRWSVDHVGLGNAYAIVTMNYDREKLTQPPQFLFEGKGAPLYDWRKDSTVGGSGAHRWNDITTWEFTENGMLMAYAYHRGIAFNGDLFCGMEVPASDLPIARWTAAANLCDEAVDGAPRYRCSIGLDCNIEHGDNIEAIMTSCGGMMVNGVGEIFPIVGSDQPIVATLTDDDMIVGEPVKFQARRSMDELVNSVSGTFPNPDNQWGPTSYATARDAGVVATDRRTRDVTLNFTTVIYPKQAANLAALYLSENRFEATASFTARPRWQVLEPGDWIAWNSARYGSRIFMVVDSQLKSASSDGPRNVPLSLQQRSGDIYDGVGIVVPDAPVNNAAPVYQAELLDFAVTAASVLGADSRARPAIRTSWTATSDPTVAAIILQWRIQAEPGDLFDRTVNTGQTIAFIVEGIMSSTIYEVRHKVIADPARVTSWSAWQEVTTGDIGLNLADLGADVIGRFEEIETGIEDVVATATQTAEDLAQEVTDRAAALAAEAAVRQASDLAEAAERIELSEVHAADIRSTRDGLLALSVEMFDLGANAVLDRQEIRRSLTSSLAGITAAYSEAITVATGPDSALVATQTDLAAQIADTNTSIAVVNAAYVTADEAIALQTTTLATQIRGAYDGSDWTQAGGMISQINASITSQYESLSEAISSVSAGVGEQFDFSRIWNFDATVQDWTGNGTPTHVTGGGWLRPANDASDPYVVSPAGLAIDLDTYGQVRLRIRKTGAPIWEGQIWWKLTGDTTWDAGRRVTVTEPSFDAGVTVVSINLGIGGELDQVRIDLSSGQDGTDYFELDWVAIGRPSPGASVASVNSINTALTNAINAEASSREALSAVLTGVADPSGLTLEDLSSGLIYSERLARVAENSALLSEISTLSGSLTTAEGNITILGAAISALDVRIEATEDGLISVQSDLVALSGTVDGKADVSALEELETTINIDNVTGISVQAQGIRALESKLLASAVEQFEVGANALLGNNDLAKATAAVRQEAFARTEENAAGITAVAGRVDVIEAALPGKAEASYVDSVEARVSETESGLSSAVGAITALETSVAGKAEASAVSALDTRVTAAESVNTSQASAITALETSVAGKASASAVDALTVRVSDTEDGLDAAVASIETQGTAIEGKADASALETTNTNVAALGDTVTALSSTTTALSAEVEDRFAGGLAQFQTSAGPAGVEARFAVALKATEGGVTANAGFYMDLRTVGGVLRSELSVFSDRFFVLKPDGSVVAVFGADGSDLILQNIKFGAGVGGTLTGESGLTNLDLVNDRLVFSEPD